MVAAVLFLLVREVVPPSAAMLGGVVAVLVAGVVNTSEALAGFSNPAPFTVAALYVLARGVERTGALAPVVRAVLGEGGRRRRSLARLIVPTAGASAFLNNTPIVAVLMPQVASWAEERQESPSHYLMPLSFAAILGGVVTLIGTSTNIVVAGLLQGSGQPPLGFFELAPVGLPVAVGGSLLLVLLAPVVLPARRSARQEMEEELKQFTVDMRVDEGGPLDGRPVEAAGLRHLRSVFLATIERDGDLIAPVTPQTVLRGGDRLRFVGRAGHILDLQAIRGLSSTELDHLLDLDATRARSFEAVIGPSSPLVGKTLRETGFRSRYQAVVLAIHRAGQRVDAKLGQVPLRVGDTLLVLADPDFSRRWRDRHDFLLVSSQRGPLPVPSEKAPIVGIVAASIVLAASTGLLPILHAALLGALALVAFRILTPGEARDAVDLDVVLLIAAAFGLGAAMQESGLAGALASGLLGALDPLGPLGVLLGLVGATVALTGLVTNNAAAVLMFPIALSASAATGIDLRPLAVAIAVSASVDFLTPIGYQTNTMVYGPGGYRFLDYARLGAPLTLLVVATILVTVPVVWPL